MNKRSRNRNRVKNLNIKINNQESFLSGNIRCWIHGERIQELMDILGISGLYCLTEICNISSVIGKLRILSSSNWSSEKTFVCVCVSQDQGGGQDWRYIWRSLGVKISPLQSIAKMSVEREKQWARIKHEGPKRSKEILDLLKRWWE